MLCPEDSQFKNENLPKEGTDISCNNDKKLHEGSGNLELNRFKNLKTWKKSLTSFFRNQLRSSKSNDGDRPSGSKENFEEKEISSEQKWQSLGKVFRRQSFVEHWQRSPTHGESSSQNKRIAVRKVLSSYFGKTKSASQAPIDTNEN